MLFVRSGLFQTFVDRAPKKICFTFKLW
uniref:Uncharacterized protein n=1 Tax=Rhizophora mucronata TaxID=61149 RepID=A0A2P2PTW2_RHIMU